MVSAKRRNQLLIALGALALSLWGGTQVLKRLGKVDTDQLVAQMLTTLEQNDFEEAGRLMDRILANDPDNAIALFERGKLWAAMGEVDAAMEDWNLLCEQQPLPATLASQACYQAGVLQLELGHAQSAEEYFLKSWTINTSQIQPLEHALRIHVLQMRREETRRILNFIEQRRSLSLEEPHY